MNTKLDTRYFYQTPEGVELSFSLAGPIVRGMAWVIDFAIRALCYLFLALFLSFLGGVGSGMMLIGLFVIEWFYPVFFEVRTGRTPGKKAMGLQVVHDDGTPIYWSSSLLRNLLRSIDFLPFLNMTGFITMLLNPRFKRLGDYAAGTVVIHIKKEDTGRIRIPQFPPRPTPLPLKIEEQRMILDFCERAEDLSTERRHELALLLGDLTGGDVPEKDLYSYGNWLLKGRGRNESAPV